MNTPFSDLNIAPGVGADIMQILGVSATDLNFPKKLQQVQDITNYFKTFKNYREKILDVVLTSCHHLGRPSEDKIDMVWSYVQLQLERQNKISSLDPNDFEPNVEQEIKNRYLTKENISRVKEDISKRIKQEKGIIEDMQEKKQKTQLEEKRVTQAVANLKKYNTITLTLEDVEKINKLLNYE